MAATKKLGSDILGTWSADDTADFWRRYKEWEDSVKEIYSSVAKDEIFGSVTSRSINMGTMLNALPKKLRQPLMEDYKRLIEFNRITSSAPLVSGGAWSEWADPMKDITTSRPYAKYSVDPDILHGGSAHPLAWIYNQTNINLDPKTGALKVGGNIPTSAFAQQIMDDSPIAAGKRVTVLDTETAGLTTKSGIREIATQTVSVGDDGAYSILGDKALDIHLPVARMEHGALFVPEEFLSRDMIGGTKRVDGMMMRMDKAMESMFGVKLSATANASGEEFVEALRPFLEQMKETDVLVGHNIGFDIEQILKGLKSTGIYQQNIGGFQSEMDAIEERIFDPKRMQIKDTLAMARDRLPGMETAEELKWLGENSKHSLQNLLLETNLTDLLAKDGVDLRGELVGTGKTMHSADIDTKVEAHLLKYLESGDIQAVKRGTTPAIGALRYGDELRRSILTAYAPTPMSNIDDIRNISREVFSEIWEEQKSLMARGASPEEYTLRVLENHVTTRGKVVSDSLADADWMGLSGGEALTADEAYNSLRAGKNLKTGKKISHYKVKVNPLEQEIFGSRRALVAADVADDNTMAFGLGKWRRWSGVTRTDEGFLNRASTLFLKGSRRDGYEAFQNRMAREGMPFAGISETERRVTSEISHAGSMDSTMYRKQLNAVDRNMAAIGDDIGVSRFGAIQKPYARVSDGVVQSISLNHEIIRAAENADIGLTTNLGYDSARSTEMLGLSVFKTDAGDKRANLMFRFGGGTKAERGSQAKIFADWFGGLGIDEQIGDTGKTLADYGFSSETQRTIAAGIQDVGSDSGVAVGHLDGKAGEVVHDMIADLNQDLFTDAAQIELRAGSMGAGPEDKFLQAGAWIMDRVKTPEISKAYDESMKVAEHRLGGLEKIAGTPRLFTAAKTAYATGRGDAVKSVMNAWERITPHVPKIAGIAALGTAAYYMFHKKQENDFYDDARVQMAYDENGADYSQYRRDLGLAPAPAQRTMDPFATAGLVGTLDRNKINHALMGTDKNSHLYGGMI